MRKVGFVLSINVCLISVFVEHTTSEYHVQYFQQHNTWFEAQSYCHGLGGSLTINKMNGVNCNEVTGVVDSTKVSTFWTGEYNTNSHWISKIGCIEILGQPNVSVAPTVSRCLEICKTRHINVEILAHIENRCLCISSNITSFRKMVGVHLCSNLKVSVSSNRYWAFSVIRNKTLTGTGNCAFVNCIYGPVLYTSECRDERRPFCNSTVLLNWTMSQEHCKDKIPGNLSEICHTMPTEQTGAWLPIHRVIIRTDVRQDLNFDEEAVTGCTSIRCSYNKGVSTTFQVNTPCREKTDGFFCTLSSYYGMTTDGTNASNNSFLLSSRIYNYKTTKGFEKTDNALEITGKSSVSTVIELSSMLQSTTSIAVQQIKNMNLTKIPDRHTTSEIGLIFGGVLGALAVIGFIVLVVILKLRRTKASTKRQRVDQFKISNGESLSYEDKQRGKLSNNLKLNKLYENDCAHTGGFVTGKTMETEVVNAQEGRKPNDVYAVVMKDNMTPPLQVEFNSVVDSEEATESEYDRLNITPKFLADKMENNVYDSSIADRSKSDPTYNTATNIMHNRQNNTDVYDIL